MFDLGDVVPLSVTITDTSGQPANAGSVSVTVTLPDGTQTTAGPVSPTSTGVYDYDYVTVQAGRHAVRWVATGAHASAYTDAFLVEPTTEAFVSLADAKDYMKKSRAGTADDEELRGFVMTACRMIRDRMGEVSPVTVVEEIPTGCGDVVVLKRRPVISVTSVLTLPGLAAVPQADQGAGTDGWILDGGSGVLRHTRAFPPRVRGTYRAGRTPVPPNFRLAGLELTMHLWRGPKLNAGGGRPALSGDTTTMAGSTFALPIRVRELLGLGRDTPRDEVLVG